MSKKEIYGIKVQMKDRLDLDLTTHKAISLKEISQTMILHGSSNQSPKDHLNNLKTTSQIYLKTLIKLSPFTVELIFDIVY